MTAQLPALSAGRPPEALTRLPRTVGVEEELLLVDTATLRPVPVVEEVLRAAPAGGALLEREAKREQIEVVSPPLRTLDEVRAAILAGRQAADDAARIVGARAVPLATAPLLCASHPVSTPRYNRMHAQFGLTMVEQLTCGFHVHIGVDSPAEGVGVLDRIRPWLPVLLALSANSPFWQGLDTGFASYRYQAWGRWPTAGAYDRFGSVSTYREVVAQVLAADVPLDAGMLYFDARLSTHVPTVEIRIADVCLNPDDAAALAILARALVQRAADDWAAGVPADGVSATLLRLASWRASRFGVGGALLHPIMRRLCAARDAAYALLDHVSEAHPARDEAVQARRAVDRILARGNGAAEQRRVWSAHGNLESVVEHALFRPRPF